MDTGRGSFVSAYPNAGTGLAGVGLWEAAGHCSGDGGAQSEVPPGTAGGGSGVPRPVWMPGPSGP